MGGKKCKLCGSVWIYVAGFTDCQKARKLWMNKVPVKFMVDFSYNGALWVDNVKSWPKIKW